MIWSEVTNPEEVESGSDPIVEQHAEAVEIIHWGLVWESPQEGHYMQRTVAICRVIETGECMNVLPTSLKFDPETHKSYV